MSFRGTFISVCLIVFFLAGCGGGTSGDQRVSQGQTQDLTLSVQLLQSQAREYLSQSELPENRFASVIATLEQDLSVAQTAEVSVGPQDQSATLSFLAVPVGTYVLRIRGFNADGQELAQASAVIDVFPGRTLELSFALVAGPIEIPEPVARDITYQTAPGETLTVDAAQGVLSNDTTNGGTASLVTGPTQGTLDLLADGSFTYTSEATATGVDTFVYQLNDPRGTDQATVTLNFSTGRAFFVQAGSSGTGNSAQDPRPDLDGAADEAGPGDTIFVLFSNQALQPGAGEPVVTFADQVSVLGSPEGVTPRFSEEILTQSSGSLPEIRFLLQAGNQARFENLRLVGDADSPPLLDLSGKQNALVRGMEFVSPSEKIRLENFTGTLDIEGCRFTGSVPSLGQAGDIVVSDVGGILASGQTQINVSDSDLDGVTFLVSSRFSNTCTLDVRDSQLSGNFNCSAVEGGRLDFTLEDCEFVPLASNPNHIAGIISLIHRTGGQGDVTVRRISKEFSRRIDFQSVDQTPEAGGSILVQCVEGGTTTSFGLFLFNGGTYDLVVADNEVDDFQQIASTDLTISVEGGARVRALVQNNIFPFALGTSVGNSEVDVAVLGNVVGTASPTDADNPNNLDVDDIRRISHLLLEGSTPGSRFCARVEGNRVGPIGDLNRIAFAVVTAALPAEVLVEDLTSVQTNNTVNQVTTTPGVVTTPAGSCDPPDYPGPCDEL